MDRLRNSRMRRLTCCLALVIATTSGLLAQADEPVYETGNGVSAPKAVKLVHAQYTADAHKRRVQGKVELTCVVGSEGTPTKITVARPLDDDLDQEAIRALTQWRFEPGTKEGNPVSVRIRVEMAFVRTR
jgi:protein TonB